MEQDPDDLLYDFMKNKLNRLELEYEATLAAKRDPNNPNLGPNLEEREAEFEAILKEINNNDISKDETEIETEDEFKSIKRNNNKIDDEKILSIMKNISIKKPKNINDEEFKDKLDKVSKQIKNERLVNI